MTANGHRKSTAGGNSGAEVGGGAHENATLDATFVGDAPDLGSDTASWHAPRASADLDTASAVSGGGAGLDGPQPEVGDSLGRYLLVSRLGAGAMGLVYEALDPDLDRKVAIKVLRPSPTRQSTRSSRATDQASARLIREAQALAQLAHPNIVAMYDVGRCGSQVYLAMELVRGTPLDAWLASGRKPWRRVVEVFIQAADGLSAAHRAGVVHHDFKPENVLLGADGRVRILDFGLAHQAQSGDTGSRDEAISGSEHSPSLARSGQRRIAGTPSFMAPEQHLGADTDARCDQYAYCVSLFEALYGARPFRAEGLDGLAAAKRAKDIQVPRPTRRVPGWLRDLVWTGLEVDAARRHASMAAIAAILRERSSPASARYSALIVVVGLALVGTGWQFVRAQAQHGACEAGAERRHEIWHAELRAQIGDAFEATKLRHAPAVFRRAESIIDHRLQSWSREVVEACGLRGQKGLDRRAHVGLRLECLSSELDQTQMVIESWRNADARVVESAESTAESLAPVEDCRDPELWLSRSALPRDPAARARALKLESEIFAVGLARRSGKLEQAWADAQKTAKSSERIGYRSGSAASHMLLARIAAETFKPTSSRAHAQRAMEIAEASGDDGLAARVAAEQIWVLGYMLRDFSRADELIWPTLARISSALHRLRQLISSI